MPAFRERLNKAVNDDVTRFGLQLFSATDAGAKNENAGNDDDLAEAVQRIVDFRGRRRSQGLSEGFAAEAKGSLCG